MPLTTPAAHMQRQLVDCGLLGALKDIMGSVTIEARVPALSLQFDAAQTKDASEGEAEKQLAGFLVQVCDPSDTARP